MNHYCTAGVYSPSGLFNNYQSNNSYSVVTEQSCDMLLHHFEVKRNFFESYSITFELVISFKVVHDFPASVSF